MKITTVHINNGFREPVIKSEDYVFDGERSISLKLGSLGLDDKIVNPDGQWDAVLPEYEVQAKGFETFGCTAFNSTNQIEIQEKFLFGGTPNYSDRALYVMAGITPPGTDPNEVYEVIRKNGLLYELVYPWSDDIHTLAEYARPLSSELIAKAKLWLHKYNLKHEFLRQEADGNVNPETIKEALKRSCLAVAVQAWSYDGEKYVRTGNDTHWTTLVGTFDNGDWKVYDSYAPHFKRLDKNFGFRWVKRIWLSDQLTLEELSIYQKIVNILAQIVGIQAIFVEQIVKKQEQPKEEPKPKSRITEWADAIEEFENAPKHWNNPGAIKDKNGKFLTFKTYDDGRSYLCDYLTRACTGKHAAFPQGGETTLLEFTRVYAPSNDNNNPESYCAYVAGRLGEPITIKIKELL